MPLAVRAARADAPGSQRNAPGKHATPIHISLNVRDLEASVDFYEKVFGVPAAKRRPGYAKFDLATPALNLTMQEAAPTGVNASHFGVQCETSSDVDAAR